MPLEIIGPRPWKPTGPGGHAVRIGTLFPDEQVLCTTQPGVHALQRLAFLDHLNSRFVSQGRPALTPDQEDFIAGASVDLIFNDQEVMIRPDPDRMDLAFAADELLQGLVSKRFVKFLSVSDGRVREAIRRRGELWRLSGVPKTREAKQALIQNSRVALRGLPIYYYNRLTGTRWLTCQEFERLGTLDDRSLALHLQEIADHALQRNRLGRVELDFFAADLRRFGGRNFGGVVFEQLAPAELRQRFLILCDQFRMAAHEAFRRDDPANKGWLERMLSTLFLDGNETQSEQVLSGLSPEFFLQVEWLPGGRFESGEFLFDSIYDEAGGSPALDGPLRRLCDPRTKGIILNYLRDYGDLDYINIGCVPEPLSLDRPQAGRRGVYLAEFASRSRPLPIRRFLRFQKWDVWEHLDEGKDLLSSIQESDEYNDYCLDRRLGCRQLGMNLVRRITVRRLVEPYGGRNQALFGVSIRTTYFDREYLPGIATDKLPLDRYSRPGYALQLADLLGRAAASSLIVGRCLMQSDRVPFDDGDEVVFEDESGLPVEILVADHTGAFAEYEQPLENQAASYARPVNKRDRLVPDGRQFAERYMASLREQFLQIQGDYRKRRRAFDTLFKHATYDPKGSFAYRWECILRRLDHTEVDRLLASIQSHTVILK